MHAWYCFLEVCPKPFSCFHKQLEQLIIFNFQREIMTLMYLDPIRHIPPLILNFKFCIPTKEKQHVFFRLLN